MDPITTAIVSALAGRVGKEATNIAKDAIYNGYQGLKALLKQKFGDTSDLAEAVENLEKKPDSSGRRQTVAEEVSNTKAAADSEVLAAAKALLAKLEEQLGGTQQIQNVTGNYNATVQGSGRASVRVTGVPDKKDA